MTSSSWTVVGAAVRGSSHATGDVPCQDAFATVVLDGRAVLCVSDGAGSREHAAAGAQAAVAAVRDWALDGGTDAARAFGAARVAVRTLAAQNKHDADAYACTLTVAVLADGTWTVGQLGDGIAVTGSADGPVALAAAPPAEYVNETQFLTTLGAVPRWATAPAGPLALSTDGLRMKVLADLRTGRPFPAFFEDVWAWAAEGGSSDELARFLADLDDQTGDDKTLVLAVPA